MSLENPELSELEQNKRQAALVVAQQYQFAHRALEVRGLEALKRDAQRAKDEGNHRYRGWLVETYFLAIELWEESLQAPKIGSSRDLVIDLRPRPKPAEPKPTIPRPDKPIPALPIAKMQGEAVRSEEEIFDDKRKGTIARQLSGEVDLDGKEPEEFPIESFFTNRSEIVITDRTPGVFGRYYKHPLDRSPRVFRDNKQPHTSQKFKK